MTSERGKPVTKSGNECINVTFTNERRQKFNVKFTGETLEVMRYSDGVTQVIEYIKSEGNITCECGNKFYGWEGKEDTCPKCLKRILTEV